jgi:hypothetical protein
VRHLDVPREIGSILFAGSPRKGRAKELFMKAIAKNRVAAGLIATTALLAASACSGDDKEGVCTPGATQACTCPGGVQGAQSCNLDGNSWGMCACASSGDGGSSYLCIPNSTQNCLCTGGAKGSQACGTTGKSWSTCDCTTVYKDGGGAEASLAAPVGKFCHAALVNGQSATLQCVIGSGSTSVTLSAWTGSCNTSVGTTCVALPTGVDIPINVFHGTDLLAKGTADISKGEDWIFVVQVTNGTPELIGGSLKATNKCSSYSPF